MITVEVFGQVFALPESADEIPGTCRSYDPPTDDDGGCLYLLEHQVWPEGKPDPLPTREQVWSGCYTSPSCPNEGRCPFVD